MLDGEDVVAALPGLYRYALALVRDPQEAEDLVQETVTKALANATAFRGEAAPATWLHTVAYRTFVDRYRRPADLPVAEDTLAAAVDAAWRDDAYRVSPTWSPNAPRNGSRCSMRSCDCPTTTGRRWSSTTSRAGRPRASPRRTRSACPRRSSGSAGAGPCSSAPWTARSNGGWPGEEYR